MLDGLRDLAQALSIAFFGFSSGCAWIAAIVAPNTSYDRLDHGRADGHVRLLLTNASSHIAFVLLAAAALAVLGGAMGAGIVGALAAAGFFTNRWTLAPRKRGTTPPGMRQRKKTQRVVAVSLTLIFTLVAVIATGLAIARI
ncbi:hypothetical protein [Henriciella aquimarina]|uniref:hypothetical protein n=1 Tax=Henriciella aquimarina TaxID=545261 RepID=UPI0009FC8CC2|nr:hypothetical protein [Henriciella aquimarina]